MWRTNGSTDKFIRFYFEDDIVPGSTFLSGFVPFEKLVKLFDTQPLEVTQTLALSLVTQMAEKHSTDRYLRAILFNFRSEPKNRQQHRDYVRSRPFYSSDNWCNPNTLRVSFQKDGTILVTGRGRWSGIVRASLTAVTGYDEMEHESYTTYPSMSIKYTVKQERTTYEVFPHEYDFALKFQVPDSLQGSISKLLDNQSSLRLVLSTGLMTHQATLSNLHPQKCVAVLGQVGHGKSSLLKSLLAQTRGETLAPSHYTCQEVPVHEAESFVHKGVLFYELATVGALNDEFYELMKRAFQRYPVAILMIVVKSNEKLFTKGIIALMQKIYENTIELPHVYIVVTNDRPLPDPEATNELWLADLKDKLFCNNLPAHKRHVIKVNSITIGDRPSHGMDKLLTDLDRILEDAWAVASIDVGGVWDYLRGKFNVGAIALTVGAVVWVVVTKVPPPFLI